MEIEEWECTFEAGCDCPACTCVEEDLNEQYAQETKEHICKTVDCDCEENTLANEMYEQECFDRLIEFNTPKGCRGKCEGGL